MRIVVEQRYVRTRSGRYRLQYKHMDSESNISDWEDVPIYLDDWPTDEEIQDRTGKQKQKSLGNNL